MLETAIAHYHALLDDATVHATAEQLTAEQRERNLFFGERPLVSVLRPRLISAAQYDQLRSGVGLVAQALRRLGDALLSDAALRADLALTPHEEHLIAIDPGYATHSAHSRMDTFLTLDGASLQFVEFNGESPAAIAYEDVLSDLFLRLPAMQRFAKRYTIDALPARDRLLGSLLGAWRESGRTGAPTIAILDWKGLPTRSEFLLFQRYFHEQGLSAAICSPDDLVYRDGQLFATEYEIIDAEGRVQQQQAPHFPIELVYKRVLTSELLTSYGAAALDHPLMCAYADGKVCVVNSFRAKLLHKKSIFALLHDERAMPHFSAEQRAAIAAHVPWTRLLRAGESSYQGERIADLPAFARANRDRLVLKPNDEYGGKGVVIGWEASADEWDAALAEGLRAPSVLQERVTIAYEEYPAIVDGRLQIGRRLVDSDPFVFDTEVAGCLCRLSTVTLLNVTAGGGSTAPVFVVEEKPA